MRAGVIGASGYSGQELVALLLRHPEAELGFVGSRQYAGQSLVSVFSRFGSYPGAEALEFVAPEPERLSSQADIVFMALPHGTASEYARSFLNQGKRIIDLSADHRLDDPKLYREYYGREHPHPDLLAKGVYGLPEINREKIRTAELVAGPGCYPTSIILPCWPLLRHGLIQPTAIIADSLSSPSGAGRKLDPALLFVECNESLRPYGVTRHRHLPEIEQELAKIAGQPLRIQFTPHLAPVNRGILTTIYTAPRKKCDTEPESEALKRAVRNAYDEAFRDEPFVRVLEEPNLPDTANVAHTNGLEIAWRLDQRTGRLIVMSAEDNLGKGAGGQAIQCLNVMAGFSETAGLI